MSYKFKGIDISTITSTAGGSTTTVAHNVFKNFQLPVIMTNSFNNFGIFQFPEKFIPRTVLTSLFKKKI